MPAKTPTRVPERDRRERAALAAELHDLVTHQATVATVQLAAAQTEPSVSHRVSYTPLAAARAVLDDMSQELRRLGRLLTSDHAAPLEPVPSLPALLARLPGAPAPDRAAFEALPAGVVLCAHRCLDLIPADASSVAAVGGGVLKLDITFATAVDADADELRARLDVRLEPCAGRSQVVTPTAWRLELPLRA